LNWEFYRFWKNAFVNFPTVRALLYFTTMLSKYDLYRRNFYFLPAFIVIDISIFKIMTATPTAIWRIGYDLIRIFR